MPLIFGPRAQVSHSPARAKASRWSLARGMQAPQFSLERSTMRILALAALLLTGCAAMPIPVKIVFPVLPPHPKSCPMRCN